MTCSTYHQGVSTPLGETSPSYSIVSSPYSGVVLLTGISTPHEGAISPILKASRPLTREMTPSWDVPPLRCPLQSDPLRMGHHVNLSSSVNVYSPTALLLCLCTLIIILLGTGQQLFNNHLFALAHTTTEDGQGAVLHSSERLMTVSMISRWSFEHLQIKKIFSIQSLKI